MIALIDYGSGNLRSVSKALEHEGADVRLVDSPAGLADASAMVLPGVGAFGDCVRNLRERGLWDPVQDWLASGKPFLGICLGYQLLFDFSEETPPRRERLRLFPRQGRESASTKPALKIPHMGWNTLDRNDHPALGAACSPIPTSFFVHSYFPVPDDASIITLAHGLRRDIRRQCRAR